MANGRGRALMKSMASSMLATTTMGRMGPKTSSCMAGSDGSTSASTVGAAGNSYSEKPPTAWAQAIPQTPETHVLTDITLLLVRLSPDGHPPAAQQCPDAAELLVPHNAAKIRGFLGVGAEKLHNGRPQGGHQLLLHLQAAEQVIGGQARLPRVEEAAPGHPPGHVLHVAGVRHVAGVLAPQFQCHRGQVLGSGFHDDPSHGCTACGPGEDTSQEESRHGRSSGMWHSGEPPDPQIHPRSSKRSRQQVPNPRSAFSAGRERVLPAGRLPSVTRWAG